MPGGPCPNETGQCSDPNGKGCTAVESSLWYGRTPNKCCKSCYDSKKRGAAAAGGAAGGSNRRPRADSPVVGPLQFALGADAKVLKVHTILNVR